MLNKKIFLHLSALFCTAVLIFSSSVSAYAAEDKITVNGESVSKGDTVIFEYYMGGIKDPLEAAGATIEYDKKSLEYVEGSIGFGAFGNALYNIDDKVIYYSAIDVVNGFDLSEEKLIVKLSFKVLNSAKGDIKIENKFTEIFTMVNEDVDLTEKDYTSRTVVTVNAKEEPNSDVHKGVDANKIEEYEQSSETDFDNFMLGTDKEELIASAVSSAESTTAETKIEKFSKDNTTATADNADVVSEEVQSVVFESSKVESTVSKSEKEKNTNLSVIIVAVVFFLLVIGAGVFAIMRKKEKK